MFTGIIQVQGRVSQFHPLPESPGRRLVIDAKDWNYFPSHGDSIAVNGCCLTHCGAHGRSLTFDIVPESLSRTTLGDLVEGSLVNLEHAATANTLLGGHVVQGHIDGVGTVESVNTVGEWRVRIKAPRHLMECVTPKGSITIEGVSLTIASTFVEHDAFEVALIPTTLAKTTLVSLKPGDRCNLESDVMARTLIHWLNNYAPAGLNPRLNSSQTP